MSSALYIHWFEISPIEWRTSLSSLKRLTYAQPRIKAKMATVWRLDMTNCCMTLGKPKFRGGRSSGQSQNIWMTNSKAVPATLTLKIWNVEQLVTLKQLLMKIDTVTETLAWSAENIFVFLRVLVWYFGI